MDAREGAKLIEMIKPQHVVPLHYEGWSHFQQGRRQAEPVLRKSQHVQVLRWLDPGEESTVNA